MNFFGDTMKKARKATFQDLFPKATPAEPGFAPTIHLTGIMEADEMWLLEMFTAVGNYVVAYFALEPLPGCSSSNSERHLPKTIYG
jgi:hypothetical protein